MAGLPTEALENLREIAEASCLVRQLHFYGPEETVRANWQAAKRRFSKAIAGAAFQDGEFLTLPIPKEKEASPGGQAPPGHSLRWKFSIWWRGIRRTADDPSDGHADFFATIPRKASAVWESPRASCMKPIRRWACRPGTLPSPRRLTTTRAVSARPRRFPLSATPQRMHAAGNCSQKVMDRCAEHGWGSYRTTPAFQDRLISKYSFNNNALLRFQEKLKDSIDPNGIISPGRYGIWPASMRKNRA